MATQQDVKLNWTTCGRVTAAGAKNQEWLTVRPADSSPQRHSTPSRRTTCKYRRSFSLLGLQDMLYSGSQVF
ncbi:unnamed protein product [Symbiodinium sp. CCMP2592]|nr:unnamed protein product [Symbiodinium sp. CCMP2592]